MTRRRPLAVAVAWAAVRDAVALGSTVARFVALDPVSCRLRGHNPITLANPEPLTLCLRCGSPCRAR